MEKNKKAVLFFSWAAKVVFDLTGANFYSENNKNVMQSNRAEFT